MMATGPVLARWSVSGQSPERHGVSGGRIEVEPRGRGTFRGGPAGQQLQPADPTLCGRCRGVGSFLRHATCLPVRWEIARSLQVVTFSTSSYGPEFVDSGKMRPNVMRTVAEGVVPTTIAGRVILSVPADSSSVTHCDVHCSASGGDSLS